MQHLAHRCLQDLRQPPTQLPISAAAARTAASATCASVSAPSSPGARLPCPADGSGCVVFIPRAVSRAPRCLKSRAWYKPRSVRRLQAACHMTAIPSVLTATEMVPDRHISTLARVAVGHPRCGCRYVIPGSATVAHPSCQPQGHSDHRRGRQSRGVQGGEVGCTAVASYASSILVSSSLVLPLRCPLVWITDECSQSLCTMPCRGNEMQMIGEFDADQTENARIVPLQWQL